MWELHRDIGNAESAYIVNLLQIASQSVSGQRIADISYGRC